MEKEKMEKFSGLLDLLIEICEEGEEEAERQTTRARTPVRPLNASTSNFFLVHNQYTKIQKMRDRIRVSSTDGKVQYQVLRYKGGVYTIVAQFNTRTEAKRFIDSKTAR